MEENNNQETVRNERVLPSPKKISPLYPFFKRLFDILLSLVAILLLSWLILILLFIQLFFTRCHPIFCDSRVGKGGKIIKILKFRSMIYDAEVNIDKYLTPEQKKIWVRERKLDNDPRITKFGKILRKTSLDELPQLFNIFLGSMSIVGPRPMSQREVASAFSEEERNLILSVRPGLTGYWQVYGRSDVNFESGRRQTLELEYFTKRGFWFDAGLIFKTFTTVLKGKGAK